MISLITQEVLKQLQAAQSSSSSASPASPQVTVAGEGTLLSELRPNAKVADVTRLIEAARQYQNFAICIPQWFVDFAKTELAGAKTKVATIVGLPEGTSFPLAKYAEIKQAVAAGVDIVLVPVNMDFCRAGDLTSLQKDLAESLTASKGKVPAAAIIEVSGMDKNALVEAAAACVSAGAEVVVLSAIAGGSVDAEVVKAVKAKGIKVGVIGGASNESAMKNYQAAGADWLVVRYR